MTASLCADLHTGEFTVKELLHGSSFGEEVNAVLEWRILFGPKSAHDNKVVLLIVWY